MAISFVSAGSPSIAPTPQSNAGVDAKIRSLEQKLQQLNREREQAAQHGDVKEKGKIKQEIQKIEEQIARLKQQTGDEENESRRRLLRTGKDEYIPEGEWESAKHH